jgi:protein involved in polysaccharide export with SLBB domain
MTRRAIGLWLVWLASSGCAAVTNPVADGVPVPHVPPEVLGRPKSELRDIPLTLLRQHPPADYLVDRGDVLAIVANEILGSGDQPPPIQQPEQTGRPAVIGWPVPVEADGTINLPYLKPISVRGKTTKEIQELLFDTITGKRDGKVLVEPKAARVTVQLLNRRTYQVMVVRGDTASGNGVGPSGFGGAGIGGGVNNFSNAFNSGTSGTAGGAKRGTGKTIDLPAYENDVLRALNASGGLPGVDAKNEVTIIRSGQGYCDAADAAARTLRIPLRVYPDEPVSFREEDVILHDGDVVVVENRETDVFYTAGLIGTGIFPLPRDSDLNILQVMALVHAPLANGSFGQSGFGGSAVGGGIGSPNASLCTVLRQLPGERQIVIRVDLNKAMVEPRERIRVLPGDYIVMQERPGEAVARYLQGLFGTSFGFNLLQEADATGSASLRFP